MKKQKKAQLILTSIGIVLILITYFYYPMAKKGEILKDKTVQKEKGKEQTFTDEKSTKFTNIEYKGLYDLDKTFTVKSKDAYILDEEPDVVYMNSMEVYLYLNDGRIVRIVSDGGRYNKATYDCFFEKNVKATDGETEIFAENLDLLATKNSVKIYNSVYLNYINGSLQADNIDYNFETKYFKVSMFDENMIKMKVTK